jgi:predicted MFS family arabinose efflux permease
MPEATPRARAFVFLLALGISGWNCGNVGPVVAPISEEFGVSLGEIGLASGTFFFVGVGAANLIVSPLAGRIPVASGIVACCLLAAAGNVIVALSPDFAVLMGGRVIAGLGTGLSFLFVPVYARALGGVRLLGLFGAGLTLGVAFALALGSVLQGEGVDWRVAFWLTALLSLLPLLLLPRKAVEVPHAPPSGEGLWREALTSGAWWRVALLGITSLSIPLVLSAWLVHYLTAGDGGVSAATAGALSFALFGVCALTRDVAGKLIARGISYVLLVVGGLLVGAAGLLLLGDDRELPAVALSIALIGVGLSLPYPLFYDEAERVLPDRPIGGLGLLMASLNVLPIVAIPLMGAALEDGEALLAFGTLAAITVVCALLNARPPIPSARPG